MHFNSFRGRGRGGFAVPSIPRGQGEDQQPNEARRVAQSIPVGNAPSRGAGWRSGPVRGLPRTRGGARANLISLPNANSAPPPIPVTHSAPVMSAPNPANSAPQSRPIISAVHTTPAPVIIPKPEPPPLPTPPPLVLPAPDPLIKLERDLSPTLPDAPPEPRLEGSVFLKRPGRIPQNSPAWTDWKNTQVEVLKSHLITVIRVLNRADGAAFDWRSSSPVVVLTDEQSANISVIRPVAPLKPPSPPLSSQIETTLTEFALPRDTTAPVASSSQITNDARTSPSRTDATDTVPGTEFLVSIPTFLHKTGFKNQEFNSWVALEKQELAARGWTVLDSEVQEEENLLELRAMSRHQPTGRRGRGHSAAESAELVPGDVDGSLQIQMPAFLDADAISRTLWIRVQVDRAEKQMERQHTRTEIVGNQLRIIFTQPEPSSSDIIDLTDTITEPGSPPEAPRKRKRSSSRPSSPEIPVAKRRADSAEPLAKALERRHGRASSSTGTSVPRASSALNEVSSKREERLSIDDSDSSETASRKLARRFIKSFLGAFSVLDRAAMQSAYDASAVLTCDLRDIGPTSYSGGLHTIGFDQILERLSSMGNFVHTLNSDYDLEITPIPDARYLLNVHGDILYLPANAPRRVMHFRHNFHLRRQRSSEDFPFSIVTHDLIVSRKEVTS